MQLPEADRSSTLPPIYPADNGHRYGVEPDARQNDTLWDSATTMFSRIEIDKGHIDTLVKVGKGALVVAGVYYGARFGISRVDAIAEPAKAWVKMGSCDSAVVDAGSKAFETCGPAGIERSIQRRGLAADTAKEFVTTMIPFAAAYAGLKINRSLQNFGRRSSRRS
jgi:hypothetical protein